MLQIIGDMNRRYFKRERAEQVTGEDLLKRASSMGEAGEAIELRRLADDLGLEPVEVEAILSVLEGQGWMKREAGEWCLTRSGWEHGRSLLRAHRIYESYLAEQTGLDPARWHAEAERQEHLLDRETVNRMADELNRPRFDPHGDAIPTRRLEMRGKEGQLLSQVEAGGLYRIKHIEDEPQGPYERLVAAGLAPEIILEIHMLNGGRFLAKWAGMEHVLDTEQAAALLVQPCDLGSTPDLPGGTLHATRDGAEVTIHSLSPAVRGLERRRLLDLGFVPGSRVVREGSGAFDGPGRFRVRGTVQALRTSQAKNIFTITESGHQNDIERT